MYNWTYHCHIEMIQQIKKHAHSVKCFIKNKRRFINRCRKLIINNLTLTTTRSDLWSKLSSWIHERFLSGPNSIYYEINYCRIHTCNYCNILSLKKPSMKKLKPRWIDLQRNPHSYNAYFHLCAYLCNRAWNVVITKPK